MIEAIEVQVISKILTCDDDDSDTLSTLLGYSPDLYFSAYKSEIQFIHDQHDNYNIIPSTFNFLAEFPDFNIVSVPEPIEYLTKKLKEYRSYLILLETFNKIKDLGQGDVKDAWAYLSAQCDAAAMLDDTAPMDIIHQASERAELIKEYNKQQRIPTGFAELDKMMYGGFSTVEELVVIIARTGAGKSWACTRFMEAAQHNGFPVAYYSPEMQSAYLATRFDTWRGHFENNKLYRGDYSNEYYAYIKSLEGEQTSAYIIEDKDFADGVSVRTLEPFVKKHGIKLLIIDGISYMVDDRKATRDQEKYKNIALGLFQLSKKYGCAVVLVMQANREVKSKDDKGEAIPSLYNAEGSDQPARIATQAFGIRQIFDKHVLDIGMLKARMADNRNPVFSYAWDINTGQAQYIPNDDASGTASFTGGQSPTMPTPSVSFGDKQPDSSDLSLLDNDDLTGGDEATVVF